MSLFKLIDGVTYRKIPWEQHPVEVQKAMSSYMMTRWLSMDDTLTSFVSNVSRYTSVLPPKACYEFFMAMLPADRMRMKYIKGQKSDKYNPLVIELLCKTFPVNKKQAVRYCELLVESGTWEADITDLCQRYGVEKKEIKKCLKVKTASKSKSKK